MNDFIRFLKNNGLTIVNEKKFINDKCEINIATSFDGEYYSVKINEMEGHFHSHDLNIYWLIGILTYYNLIDKNYLN